MDRAGALIGEPDADAGCGCVAPARGADWLRLGLALVVSGQLMVLSLARNLSAIDADTDARLTVALLGLTALGVALLGPELWRATRRALARGDASLEAMFGLALAGGLAASLWGLRTGGDVFFEVVTVVLSVHALGARLKDRLWAAALARAGTAAWSAGEATRVRDDGALERVPAASLGVGDRVAVFAGDRLPADAIVAEGAGWLDTRAIDGALAPVPVGVGDRVAGGALLARGRLRADVVRPPDEGDHARAVAALLDACARELPATSLARRVARGFVPVVVTVAVAAAAGWTWHAGPGAGFRAATAVLLVACPCGFGVATPVALWAAAAGLDARGVVVRRLGALEALAGVRAVVLDKTGTLTTVLPGAAWRALDPTADLDRLRAWVGAIEARSNHPVAAALRTPPTRRVDVTHVEDLPTGGLRARVDDSGTTATVTLAPLRGARGVEVDVDGRPVAEVEVRERLAPDAVELVAALHARGVAVEILTGDRAAPPLDAPARTAMMPAAKAERVRALRAAGPVAFVGDATNDLPALASADVSVAVRGACAGVVERADLSVARAGDLVAAIDAARRTRARLRALLTVSVVGNAVGIAVAAAGLLHPVVAAALMAGTSLVVTLAAVPPDAR